VLGLADQVGGDHHRVGLSSASTRISVVRRGRSDDPDLAEKLALGLGRRMGLPGATSIATRQIVSVPDRQAAEGAWTRTEDVDLVGAGQGHRGDRHRGRGTEGRRQAADPRAAATSR